MGRRRWLLIELCGILFPQGAWTNDRLTAYREAQHCDAVLQAAGAQLAGAEELVPQARARDRFTRFAWPEEFQLQFGLLTNQRPTTDGPRSPLPGPPRVRSAERSGELTCPDNLAGSLAQ